MESCRYANYVWCQIYGSPRLSRLPDSDQQLEVARICNNFARFAGKEGVVYKEYARKPGVSADRFVSHDDGPCEKNTVEIDFENDIQGLPREFVRKCVTPR